MADEAPLTPRQAEILNWIRSFVAQRGSPPTRAELASAFGFASPNAAESHLRALARKGAISLAEGRARGIRIAPSLATARPHVLPLVGRVAAGAPILAAEHIEDEVPVAPELFRPRADYLLKVQGESMRDVGILHGDWLAVHRTAEARNGAIVVARIDDEVTVKRFERTGALVRLHAENPAFAAIEVDLGRSSFSLEGLAVGIIRRGGLERNP